MNQSEWFTGIGFFEPTTTTSKNISVTLVGIGFRGLIKTRLIEVAAN